MNANKNAIADEPNPAKLSLPQAPATSPQNFDAFWPTASPATTLVTPSATPSAITVSATTSPVPSPARNMPTNVAPSASGSRRIAADPSASIATNNDTPSPSAAIEANRSRYQPAPSSGVVVFWIACAICFVVHVAASVIHFVI